MEVLAVRSLLPEAKESRVAKIMMAEPSAECLSSEDVVRYLVTSNLLLAKCQEWRTCSER